MNQLRLRGDFVAFMSRDKQPGDRKPAFETASIRIRATGQSNTAQTRIIRQLLFFRTQLHYRLQGASCCAACKLSIKLAV